MRVRNLAIYSAAAVVVLGIGITGGAAVAGVPTIFTPAGLSVQGPSTPMPDPHYKVNGKGLSYGSLKDSNSPNHEPDLIQAVATNGKEGFVYKKDLDDADGTTAMKGFKSPQDAVAWQNAHTKAIAIPVYLHDGVTKIGEFVIAPGSPHSSTPPSTSGK